MKLQVIALILLTLSFSSFAHAADRLSAPSSAETSNPPEAVITASGYAKYPPRYVRADKVVPRGRLLALRAAKVSCHKNMAERLDQLYVAGGKLLAHECDKNIYMKTKSSLVRGLKFIGRPKYTKEGVEVRGELPLSQVRKAFGREKLYLEKK